MVALEVVLSEVPVIQLYHYDLYNQAASLCQSPGNRNCTASQSWVFQKVTVPLSLAGDTTGFALAQIFTKGTAAQLSKGQILLSKIHTSIQCTVTLLQR